MPSSKSKGKGPRAKPDAPYTSMYLSGLGMGFTTQDLESMPFGQLMWFLHAQSDMHEISSGSKKKQGSSRDLLSMV